MKKTPDFDAAAEFMAGHARVLDRRVFQRLFQGGAPEPVRDAVAAYRNDDGGFGHALEPDLRARGQPASGRRDGAARSWTPPARGTSTSCAAPSTGWSRIAPAEGGATFVLPTLSQGPHAPWWAPAEGNPVSLIQTGQIAGVLYARGFNHPWRDAATEVNVARHRPAHRAERLRDVRRPGIPPARPRPLPRRERVAANRPVCFAPSSRSTRTPRARPTPPWTSPRSPTRSPASLFDDATIEAHLDHLAGAQLGDGGWMFNWPAWSPAAEADWRGFLTVDSLRVLRANGRA